MAIRGTSAVQDSRFFQQDKKLLARMSFPPSFEQRVDMAKVQREVVNQWVAERITQLLGFEDDIVVALAINLLEPKVDEKLDPKQLQLALTGFLEKQAASFTQELWELLLSAQSNPTGIPTAILDQKKQELERIAADKEKLKKVLDTKRADVQEQRGRHRAEQVEKKAGQPEGRSAGRADRRGEPSRRSSSLQRRPRSPARRSRSPRRRFRSPPVRRRSRSPRRRSRSSRRRSPSPRRRSPRGRSRRGRSRSPSVKRRRRRLSSRSAERTRDRRSERGERRAREKSSRRSRRSPSSSSSASRDRSSSSSPSPRRRRSSSSSPFPPRRRSEKSRRKNSAGSGSDSD